MNTVTKEKIAEAKKIFFAVKDAIQIIGMTKNLGVEHLDTTIDKAYTELSQAELDLFQYLLDAGCDGQEVYQEWRNK